MIDVKAAVRKAIEYLEQFREFIPAHEIRLEETEHNDSGYWLITLSTLESSSALATFAGLKRSYKIFQIDDKTGEVKSMKVRTLQTIE